MKKVILAIACFACFSSAIAQNKNVVSAINYLRDYSSAKNTDDLLEAKKYIDEAALNEETKGKPKTWAKRAEVYAALMTCKDEKIKNLGINFLDELFNSYKQVIATSTDKKSDFYLTAQDGLRMCAGNFFNAGGDSYKNQEYANALLNFEKSVSINKDLILKTDTLGIYYSGLSADKAGNFEKAKQYYIEAINNKYGTGYGEAEMVRPYYFLAQICKKENNDVEYLNTLKSSRAAFPNNKDLLTEEMNYYILSGKLTDALKSMDEAIAKEPNNKTTYMNKGILYDNLANPKEGKKLDEKQFEEYWTKAVESTAKAVELDANYFDALFQLGALYYNKGVRQTEFANTITGMSANEVKRYDAETKKAEALFRQALPHFEKCDAIGNADKQVLKDLYASLKQIYTFIEQPEKAKAIKAKLEAL